MTNYFDKSHFGYDSIPFHFKHGFKILMHATTFPILFYSPYTVVLLLNSNDYYLPMLYMLYYPLYIVLLL